MAENLITDVDISAVMIRHGGSFAKALGHAYQLADDVNRFRLRREFEDYWNKYRDVAEKFKATAE